MKIKEMIYLDVFSTCKVLTGELGFENDVESVMVLEAADIENWGKENQVILTSYYALSDLTSTELRIFLEKMATIGSSALIVKMDRLIKMIPQVLIDHCMDLKIPLIKIERDISYEKILLAIYRPILNYQSHVLKTYYEVRQAFTKIEKNLPSFQRIMEEFQLLIKRDCQLMIAEKNIDIHLVRCPNSYIVINSQPIQNIEFTKNNYELLTVSTPSNLKVEHALKASSYHTSFDQIQVFVYENHRPFDDADYMIIENLMDILLEKLQMEYLIQKDRFNRLNDLAEVLLEGSTFSLEEKENLLQETHMSSYPFYQGVAVSLKLPSVCALQKTLRLKFKQFPFPMLYQETKNYSIFLYNLPDIQQAITPTKIVMAVQHIFEEAGIPIWNITISRLKDRSKIHEILSECLDTMRFNNLFHVGNCISIEELGIFRYFLQYKNFDELNMLVPQDLLALYRTDNTLFTTLAYFLKNDKNYHRSAEELFLHPKTIRYRIKKISACLTIDFDNPLQLLNYQIGIYLLLWQDNMI